MEIKTFDHAVKNTLKTLTFNEKALARDLLYSRQYDSKTLRAWIRAPTLTLSQAIAQARETPQPAFEARNIELYCDTLTIDSTLSPLDGENGKEPYSISIFARKLVGPSGDSQPINLIINILERCDVAFLTPQMPTNLEITFVFKGRTLWRTRPVVEAGSFGVMYSYSTRSENSISIDAVPAPDTALESIDYLSLIKPDGTVQEKGALNDDLPRLLQMQLLVAQANSTRDRKFAVNVLDYVVAASATPYNVYMNYTAVSLRNSLSLDANVTAVSSVNIYSSKQVLKARLQAALAFEASFRDFSAQTGNAQYQTMNALNLLAKSNDALETYAFLLDIKKREYDNAIESQKKAAATFSASQAAVTEKTKEFQAGVEKFKEGEERKAVLACILGVVEVVGAVAATVATGGAAAPAIAGAAVSTAKAVGTVAKLVAKLKAIFEKLKALYEKIQPVIEKLQALVETAKEVLEKLRALKEVTDNALAMKPDVKSNDLINATAEWRLFSLEIANMEDSLKEYTIDGKELFFTALKKLVIYGETFILAQANLVQRGDELAILTLQQKMEIRDQDRLSNMVYNISAGEKVLEFLRRAMFDRLLAIRGMVYLDFATYCSAYSYHTLRTEDVISLSPVKPVSDFLEDAAKLQGAVVSYGSRVLVQSRTFTTQTLAGYDTAQTLAAQLATGAPVSITLGPNDPLWQGFSRIRVSTVRCFLEGVQIKTSSEELPPSTVRLQLSTDGRFYDIQDRRTDAAGVAIESTENEGAKSDPEGVAIDNGQRTPQLVRSFIGDPRRLLFEYRPSDGSVVCDGSYGQERDYTKHTPLTTWEIALVGNQGLNTPSTAFDFQTFTGLKLEFVCDVIWSMF